jgi:ribosomal protein S18 acetylase RimI-like enzyme
VTRPDIRAVAALMARAFADDPMLAWVVRDAAARPRALTAFFAAHIRYATRYGRLDLAPEGAGAAIWLGPDDTRMTLPRMARSGHLLLPARMGMAPWRQLLRMDTYAQRQHDRTVTERHWYLYGVGVDPLRTGRGIATALLRPALERADRDRLPCYLETAGPRTLALYERLGFRVAIPGRLPPDGPPFWSMLRPARR